MTSTGTTILYYSKHFVYKLTCILEAMYSGVIGGCIECSSFCSVKYSNLLGSVKSCNLLCSVKYSALLICC